MGIDRDHELKRGIEDAETDESVEGHVNFRPLDNDQPGRKPAVRGADQVERKLT